MPYGIQWRFNVINNLLVLSAFMKSVQVEAMRRPEKLRGKYCNRLVCFEKMMNQHNKWQWNNIIPFPHLGDWWQRRCYGVLRSIVRSPSLAKKVERFADVIAMWGSLKALQSFQLLWVPRRNARRWNSTSTLATPTKFPSLRTSTTLNQFRFVRPNWDWQSTRCCNDEMKISEKMA